MAGSQISKSRGGRVNRLKVFRDNITPPGSLQHFKTQIGCPRQLLNRQFIALQNIPEAKLASYREREELKEKIKEEVRGHNHPVGEKCGPHCPRNEHYKGPVKKMGFPKRKR
jgi:hypothetical protein